MLRYRVLRTCLWLVLAASAAWAVGSLAIAWRLSKRAREPFAETLPAALLGRARELRLSTSDREELGAWYVPAANDSAPSVALFHGLAGSRRSRVGVASVYERAGCAVLLVTHRAHGDSTGERENYGWSAQHDVIAGVAWLERERPGKPIVVCGASLGAAAATYAARELGSRVAGYVLECPYASLDIAARQRTDIYLPPVIDSFGYAGVQLGAACFAPHWKQSAPLESVRAIPREVPVLFFAGELDRRTPPEEIASIAANVNGPWELCVVPGADHDRLMRAGEVYASAVLAWLATHFGATAASF